MIVLAAPSIPYTCQFASPELVRALIEGTRALESDPRWRDYGAQTPEEYAYWALRACGVVAVKMVVEGLTGKEPRTVMDWVREGLALDGYLTEIRADRPDKPVEKGWNHSALAQLAETHGLDAELVSGVGMNDLLAYARAGRVMISSVSAELGDVGPVTRASGHLVVVVGMMQDDHGSVQAVIIHNPSGRNPALQQGAVIPASRFEPAFSGRGIVMQRRQKRDTARLQPPES